MAQAGRGRIAYLKAYGAASGPVNAGAAAAEILPAVQSNSTPPNRCRDPNTNFVYERAQPCATGDVTLSGPPVAEPRQTPPPTPSAASAAVLPRPRPIVTTDPPPPPHFGFPLTTTGEPPDATTAALINHWATAYYWIDAPRTGCLAGGPEHDPCDRARRAAETAADQDVSELRQRGWCHVNSRASNWYHCVDLPDEQLAVDRFTLEEQQSYARDFIKVATQLVRSVGSDKAWSFASDSDLLQRCRDPVIEGINCALTVAQRKDLFQQIVTYYQSLGPHYTLH